MNNTGSMERTLTTKSVSLNLRQICQWTAATSLVAAGSIALFSVSTLEKLSQNGEVSIDLSAFRKLGASSLALEQIDEQKILVEDDRILEKSLFARAEPLPEAKTKFSPIKRLLPKKHKIIPVVVAAVKSDDLLTGEEAKEIAQLETAADPDMESVALAGIYSRVRFKFLAAADRELPTNTYAELEVVPLPETAPEETSNSTDSVKTSASASVHSAEKVAEKASLVLSTELTAKPEVMKAVDTVPEPTAAAVEIKPAAIISTPGLDLVPEGIVLEKVTTQPDSIVSSQSNGVKAATGPPDPVSNPKIDETLSLHVVGTPNIDTAPENQALAQQEAVEKPLPSVSTPAVPSVTTPVEATADTIDYSADVASIYDLHTDDADDYSEEVVQTTHQSVSTPARKNYGGGISKDEKGITIAWNEKSPSPVYVGRPSERKETPPAPVVDNVLADNFYNSHTQSNGDIADTGKAIKTTKPQETAAEIDLKKCDTARFGFEAFNPGAEKDSLTICRRALSQEGTKNGSQAKWWEAYGTEKEHWPTLALLRESQISETSRIPMLSNASIRILSAISKTNTHTGTGILFGEIPRGLEIQLLGRSDSPIYLDGGMKVRDAVADATGFRQFVFLNVQPGQPLLVVKDSQKNISGALPLVVKAGTGTYVKVPEPKVMDLQFRILDASSSMEKRLSGLTGEIVGQSAKIGISDRTGTLKISKVAVLGDFPLYIDILQSEKGYKNRYRIRPEERDLKSGSIPLFFFNEGRVDGWLKQLTGGVSPFSGLIVGVIAPNLIGAKKDRALRIGTLEKKSTLVPERYILSNSDQLSIKDSLESTDTRFIGVQIPEGAAIPSLIDKSGGLLWSEIVYAQPGVINVVGP